MNKTLTAIVSASLLGLALGSVQTASAGEMEQAQECVPMEHEGDERHDEGQAAL